MARVQFGELRSIKLRIFVTIENNEINKKCSYLCEILLDLRKKNEIWDASWNLFAGRPLLTYATYILLNTREKKKKKENFGIGILKSTLKYPRRAPWDFQGVLDESFIFVYELCAVLSFKQI